MGFTFSLETILRFRLSIEDRECLKLSDLMSQLHQLDARIERIQSAIDQLKSGEMLSTSSASAAELQHTAACHENFRNVRKHLLIERTALELGCKEQRERYRKARQEREILESLRERQLTIWTKQESRRERNAADDLYLLRRSQAK